MKIIEIANGRSDARRTDRKSVLEQRLADLEATVRRRQKDWLAARAAAAAESQDDLAEIIVRERAARILLEQELEERRAQFEKDIARADAVRAMIDEQLCEAALEVKRARQAEASAAAAVQRLTTAEADAVARLAEREAEFTTELSAVTETRDGLEQQLSYVESALASARQRHELAAQEVERLTRRETDLTAQYTGEAATRAALERRVAEIETALASARTSHANAEEQHRSAMAAAASRLVEREAQFETELASITARRDGLEHQLRDVESRLTHETGAREKLEQAVAELNASAAAAEQRFRDDTATLAERARADQVRLQQELSEREAELHTELASVTATLDRLEEQRRGVETALAEQIDARLALERAIVEQRSVAAAAEQRFREDIAALTEKARAERAALEDQLSRERGEYETRRADDQQQHQSALATAATRLAEREAQFEAELASITGRRDSLEEQLRDVEARLTQETGVRQALEQAIADFRSSAAAAEQRLREEHATLAENGRAERGRLKDQLSRERRGHKTEMASITATCGRVEQQLREVQAALAQQTDARLALERAIAEERSAAADAEQRFRDDVAALTENARGERDALEDQLSRERRDHDTRRADDQQQYRAAMAAAATRLAEREAQFETELASIAARRDGLQEQLRDIETRLTQETGARAALERAIADLRSAAAAAEQQHRTAMASAATRLAKREAQFQTEVASLEGARDRAEQQLREVEAALAQQTDARLALEHAIAEQRSAAADAEQRFRDDIGALTDNARVERAALESQLSRERRDHDIRLADEEQQHRSALAVAATRLAEREAHFETELASITERRDSLEEQLRGVETRLTHETAAREALEQAITDLRSAAAVAEQRFREEATALAENARAEQARLEDQMSRERHDHRALLADEQAQRRLAMADAATRLAEREAQLKAEVGSLTATRVGLEQQLRAVNAKLEGEAETRGALERAIAEAQAAAAEAETRFRAESAAITEKASAEQTRLEAQISRERALAAGRLAARGAEFESELERLSGSHTKALASLQATIAERDSRIEEHVTASAALQARLDASEAENRRQFEQTPVPLVRCTRDGAVAGVNHAFADLVGCRTPGELRNRKFAETLFESRNDLAWLVERSINSAKTESVETTCIRKDGARVAVRLSARPSASGSVEIAAEDLTGIRVLEDRLREAHRMEAVGRVASEIAMSCEKLLRDVYREAQRLLTSMTGSDGRRDLAETLLDDVTLAGSILHQLVAYGDEQTAALAPVDVNRILSDLQPVLKQVAGDAITLELRKTSSPVNVDVNAERVERLLVNVASFGRQRMPHGGRLRIELSTVVVDGKFIAQYPNVRQGLHALITVTEVARPAADDDHAHETDTPLASGRPRVDLSALQELISECGGHLWITAEPGWSMVVRMRLPLRAAWESQANGRARQGLGRMTARIFGR